MPNGSASHLDTCGRQLGYFTFSLPTGRAHAATEDSVALNGYGGMAIGYFLQSYHAPY